MDPKLEKQFLSDSLSYESYMGDVQQYSGSNRQKETYQELFNKDVLYQRHIIDVYGSFENYKLKNKIFTKGAIYDPTIDHIVDTTIITEDTRYKTDHISSSELIMESMSGVCSFNFIKKDGTTQKVNGTLDGKYMPGNEQFRRRFFFSPLPGERIVVWDISKQKWASFYMNRLFKFVRDDTTDIE
jgi:hypothetical protein